MTYAVVWKENESSGYSGRLELETDGMLLSGSKAGWRRAHHQLRYDELAAVYFERRAPGTLQPTLVFVTKDQNRIEIASLDGLGALHELAEHVESARGKAAVEGTTA